MVCLFTEHNTQDEKKLYKRYLLTGVIVTILTTFIIYFYFFFYYCQTHVSGRSEFGKFPILDSVLVDKSYTLISPFTADENFSAPGKVYLLDLMGYPVHTWETKYQTMYAQLEKNGNIIVSMIYPTDIFSYPGGKTGLVQELDWNSNVLWEYKNDSMHHDFEILPNGNIAFLVWEKVPDSIARNIKGGIKDRNDSEVLSDGIIEVNRKSEIVWSWHSYEHLPPQNNSLDSFTPKSEWTHANSIRFFSNNKGKSGYLVSLRHLKKVIMIEKDNGKIFWESPKGMLSYQHDATLLDNGNVLVFDNGLFRNQKKPFLWSCVVEINPFSNAIVWEFNGGKTGPERAGFAASIMSGAQRLKNGNTLVIDALHGHLFEVTSDGNIVWDFVNPFFSKSTGPFNNNVLFKSRRYYSEDINSLENVSSPLPWFTLQCRLRNW